MQTSQHVNIEVRGCSERCGRSFVEKKALYEKLWADNDKRKRINRKGKEKIEKRYRQT